MRRPWRGQGLMWAIAIIAAGCSSREVALRPPKYTEEIAVPPLADGKFSKPPQYPDGTLNQGDPSRAHNRGGAPNLNAMNGMGGMGGMGGGGLGGGMPGSAGSLGYTGGAGGMGMGR